jgi:hypothetical protein
VRVVAVIPSPLLFPPLPGRIDGCKSPSLKALGIRLVHEDCLRQSGCLLGFVCGRVAAGPSPVASMSFSCRMLWVL